MKPGIFRDCQCPKEEQWFVPVHHGLDLVLFKPSAGFQDIKRLLEQSRNVINTAIKKSAMNEIKSIVPKRPVTKSLVKFTRTSQIGISFFSYTSGLGGGRRSPTLTNPL